MEDPTPPSCDRRVAEYPETETGGAETVPLLPRPIGSHVPKDSLVFSCAEAITGTETDFGNHLDLFAAMKARPNPRTRAVAPLYPAYSYARPKPRYLAGTEPEAVDRIAKMGRDIDAAFRTMPPSIVCESRDVRINGDIIHFHEDGQLRILYETCRFNDAPSAEGSRAYDPRVDERPNESGVYLHLASVGSHNYGHWLTDDMPRLRAFYVLRHIYPNRTITIVTPSYNITIDEVRLRTIRLFLGWDTDWHVLFLNREKVYGFNLLYHVTPCCYQPVAKSPAAIGSVRHLLRRNTRAARRRALVERMKTAPLDTLRGAGRRIFIDRQPFRGRAIVNRAEIMAILQKRGFEILDPETMSPTEQVVRFAYATVVVGIMGAAMTNTVFCLPGTRVVHLSPDATGWPDPFFYDLASVCDHRYAAIYGQWIPSDEPSRLWNFTLDPDLLEEALRRV